MPPGRVRRGVRERRPSGGSGRRDQHVLLPVDEETARIYAGVVRDLRGQGRLIGGNDLWIAASSLRHRLPVVTANPGELRRIEGLEAIAYREA